MKLMQALDTDYTVFNTRRRVSAECIPGTCRRRRQRPSWYAKQQLVIWQ